jgi:hypothetical protein
MIVYVKDAGLGAFHAAMANVSERNAIRDRSLQPLLFITTRN